MRNFVGLRRWPDLKISHFYSKRLRAGQTFTAKIVLDEQKSNMEHAVGGKFVLKEKIALKEQGTSTWTESCIVLLYQLYL